MDAATGLPQVRRFMDEHGLNDGFSMTCAFSITMWIHLNHGDDGLERFVLLAATLTAAGGAFLVEPQRYKVLYHTPCPSLLCGPVPHLIAPAGLRPRTELPSSVETVSQARHRPATVRAR